MNELIGEAAQEIGGRESWRETDGTCINAPDYGQILHTLEDSSHSSRLVARRHWRR